MRPVLSVVAAVLMAVPATVHADPREADLQRLSQSFSDACAKGDAQAIGRMLDDHVVFMNENGDIAAKADLLQITPPPAGGPKQSLVQRDFHVEFHDDVAVTRFEDDSTVEMYGQTLKTRYLSTEVWRNEDGRWQMISSQTMVSPDDPPAIALTSADMNDYAGRYAAGDGYVLTIARDGDTLKGSTNGGAPYLIEAEARDVLFTPGQPRLRRIIERDASGRIVALHSRRDGHDFVLKRI